MHKVIKRRTGLSRLDLREVWTYRELLGFLAWRDILVRYKQTVIGILWALIRPILTMAVLTIIFGKIARLPSGNVPYPLLTFAALLPWQYFATALSDSGGSVVGSASLISRVYFPRLIIPLSAVVAPGVDLLVSLAFFFALTAYYGVAPSYSLLWLPAFFLLCLLAALGLGIWLAALYVRFRDVRHLLPFVVQIGLYVSPVGFSTTIVPDRWRLAYSLNPMVGVIDGFRWSLLGGASPLYVPGLLLSTLIAVGLLLSGAAYFNRTERTFADII